MTDARAAEQHFYSRYDWCLNPVLSIQDLLQRFQEEIDGYSVLSGWQREESKANLYLFACAIACTSDDYFGLRWLNLRPVAGRIPQQLKPALSLVQSIGDTVQSAIKVQDIAAWRWRRRWDECVSQVCKLVIADAVGEAAAFDAIRKITLDLGSTRLPAGLLRRRMRLPEAFRSQDMAHHDVITLADRFSASDDAKENRNAEIVIMGLRTAGAYFAPLMVEYLKKNGFPNVSWFSIRPKNGITRWEAQRLKSVARGKKRILIVDDYPSTGHTFRLTFEILHGAGVQPEQMSVLAPTHPAQTKWAERAGIKEPIRVFTFPTSELYKVKRLSAPDVERLYCEYFGDACAARLIEDSAVDEINRELAEHSKDGHHVREKRVVTIRFRNSVDDFKTRKILFKSTGWGWLGYHAYIAGTRLQEFVPEIIGLRNGMLAMEWVENAHAPDVTVSDNLVVHIARYIAARACRVPVKGDCRLESRTYRWTGCDDILHILRGAYGPYVNRLKVPALRNQLQQVVTAAPTFIDGRMPPEEWLQSGDRLYKGDFEHHNFGGGELDIVDPAYDLAAAIHEFRLQRDDERQLLQVYAENSGDSTVHDRILLHKILYGTIAMKRAAHALAAGREPEKDNERKLYARNFLVYSMNEFCAHFAGARPEKCQWSPLLFFMDLDGVFDHELLGFPHATRCGLQSILLLRSHGFSIVLNTGRSVQHVRQYCSAYGFPGGVAEYGSVFLDNVNCREIPLIDQDAAEQLKACREALRSLTDVFTDPGYEYSIRAYRYTGTKTRGLPQDEIKKLLNRPEFSKLTYIVRHADTYIVQRRTGKGSALRAVRKAMGAADVPVTAIGDDVHDIGMLAAADFAYAPANCSQLIRDLAKQGKCRIVNRAYQNGLLAAVQHRLQQQPAGSRSQLRDANVMTDERQGLMESLLAAADRRPVPQLLS
ncbi:MAG TPA: HAD hydrolase family protein, partial [Terriglobia bacterium]|nr:HAD hydrolase family protein [Terriglobia bacterium]